MHTFMSLYLVGLLLGIVFYAMTYYFSDKYTYKKRSSIIAVVGGIILIGSLAVGGFEGMPFGVLSLGVFTVAVVLLVFGKNPLLKKVAITFTVLFAVSMFALTYINEIDYWIVKKTQYDLGDDFGSYVEKLQTDTSIRGYETFTISEGSKAVVLSLGDEMAGNNIEVLDVEEYGNTTEIKVRTFNNQSDEENSVIAIGLDRIQSNIIIMDTDGTIYKEAADSD